MLSFVRLNSLAVWLKTATISELDLPSGGKISFFLPFWGPKSIFVRELSCEHGALLYPYHEGRNRWTAGPYIDFKHPHQNQSVNPRTVVGWAARVASPSVKWETCATIGWISAFWSGRQRMWILLDWDAGLEQAKCRGFVLFRVWLRHISSLTLKLACIDHFSF